MALPKRVASPKPLINGGLPRVLFVFSPERPSVLRLVYLCYCRVGLADIFFFQWYDLKGLHITPNDCFLDNRVFLMKS